MSQTGGVDAEILSTNGGIGNVIDRLQRAGRDGLLDERAAADRARALHELVLCDNEVALILRALEGYAAVVDMVKSPEANICRELARTIEDQI